MSRAAALSSIVTEAHRIARLAMSQDEGLHYSACLTVGMAEAWKAAKRPSTFGHGIFTPRHFGMGLNVTGYESRSSKFIVEKMGGGRVSPCEADRNNVTYSLGAGTYRITSNGDSTWICVPEKGAAEIIEQPSGLWADRNATAAALNAERGLPTLLGSPKQIAWAESIRARRLAELADYDGCAYEDWRAVASASAWIDMRNAPCSAFETL